MRQKCWDWVYVRISVDVLTAFKTKVKHLWNISTKQNETHEQQCAFFKENSWDENNKILLLLMVYESYSAHTTT